MDTPNTFLASVTPPLFFKDELSLQIISYDWREEQSSSQSDLGPGDVRDRGLFPAPVTQGEHSVNADNGQHGIADIQH
jgi:hypothetical protein